MSIAHCFYLETEGGDVLQTEGGDDILLYCLIEGVLTYGMVVDWDGDGEFGGHDHEESQILRWKADRGRDRLIGGKGRGFEPYRVGTLRVDLDNGDGRFNPYNAAGELYGMLDPGKLMKFEVAVYDDVAPLGFVDYAIFTGYLTNLVPQGWNKIAYLEFEDGLGLIQGKEIQQVATSDYKDDVAGWVENIADLAEYPFSVNASSDDPGDDYFLAQFFISPNDALDELHKLTSSTLGSIACEGDGTLAYHSIHEADAAVATLTDENTLDNPVLPNPWEFRRDQVVINGYFLEMAYPVLNTILINSIYDITPPIYLEASEETIQTCKYYLVWDAPTGGILSKPMVGGINEGGEFHCLISNNPDPAGTPLTQEWLPTVVFVGIDHITLAFNNVAVGERYVHYLSFYQSIAANRRLFDMQPYRLTYGGGGGSVSRAKFIIQDNLYWSVITYFSPITGASRGAGDISIVKQQARVDRLGNLLADYLASNIPHPTLQIEARTDLQFTLDVEKRVRYTSATMGIDADYRVAGLKHETLGTTQAVRTTVYLYPVIEP